MVLAPLSTLSARPPHHPLIPKKNFKVRRIALLWAMLLICIPASMAFSAKVTLQWEPPVDSNLKGFLVFARTADQPYDYTAPCWQGSATRWVVADVDLSQPTFFVVRAFDAYGQQSADSNEVAYQPPAEQMDSDSDGMPDEWEIRYGLDPQRDDASEDLDGDSIDNRDEYRLSSNPLEASDGGQPEKPVWVAPDSGSVTASMTPELMTGPFSAANTDDDHFRTQWQIVRGDDGLSVFDVSSETCLTALTVPQYILEQDTQYFCRVRFIDNLDAASQWSEPLAFETPLDERDSDSDGIPDDQAVYESLDLNEDGIADDLQPDAIKCAYSEPGGGVIAIQIDDSSSGAWISALQVDPPEAASNSLAESDLFPFGVILYKLQTPQPGDVVRVTIILPEAAPTDARWFQADANGRGKDYSEHARFSKDRKTVLLELKDGDYGDVDGLANGVIVDHSGLSVSSSEASGHPGGGSSGGCFIAAAHGQDVRSKPVDFLLRQIRWVLQ